MNYLKMTLTSLMLLTSIAAFAGERTGGIEQLPTSEVTRDFLACNAKVSPLLKAYFSESTGAIRKFIGKNRIGKACVVEIRGPDFVAFSVADAPKEAKFDPVNNVWTSLSERNMYFELSPGLALNSDKSGLQYVPEDVLTTCDVRPSEIHMHTKGTQDHGSRAIGANIRPNSNGTTTFRVYRTLYFSVMPYHQKAYECTVNNADLLKTHP